MEKYRGKTLEEWRKYIKEDKQVGIRATKYILVLEELVEELHSKLHQPTVISAVCEHTKGSCKIVDKKHTMKCDDCGEIIWTQDVKKCDNIWCEDGKVNVYGNEWQSCPRCRDKQTDL